jgi:uncharacterized protein (TIGR00251 family)
MHDLKMGMIIAVRVTPRASKNEIAEILSDGTIKIRIIAPPVEGKANIALLKFLSKVLDVPFSKLEIISGATGRDKRVFVIGIEDAALHKKILEYIGRADP